MPARVDGLDAAERAAGVWAELRAPLPADAVKWRQQGKPVPRDGRTIAQYVAHTTPAAVRDRLDDVCAGEWDLMLDALPPLVTAGGEVPDKPCGFKARLQILGVVRECVGQGADYKTAASDAFKRAAVRFGIGRELADLPKLWVEVEVNGRFVNPKEDPSVVYARKLGRAAHGTAPAAQNARDLPAAATERDATRAQVVAPPRTPAPALAGDGAVPSACPKCGTANPYDNRATKRNPRAPDAKCRDRSCDWVQWPPKEVNGRPAALDAPPEFAPVSGGPDDDGGLPF